jgi:hypothetical protein
MFKKTLLSALLATVSLSAFAAGYYIVVPVPNRAPTAGNILVSLNGYALPAGLEGQVYASFDFNSVLQVQGDPGYEPSNVRWSVVGGVLPAGLTLSPRGELTGTPASAGTASIQVMAAYKTKAGQTNYQLVVAALAVTLAPATVPAALAGQPYTGFDFKPSLAINDAGYAGDGAGVTWSIISGSLPEGMALANGVLGGTPTTRGTWPITVRAAYRSAAGTQSYTMQMRADVQQYAGYRAWSDSTYARTCNEYLHPADGFSYAGAAGDGVYRIDPDGNGGVAPFDVTCDMTTQGGGWTAVPYAADLPFVQQFTGGDVYSYLPKNFSLALSDVQINALRAASTTARQRYVGQCAGVLTYQNASNGAYTGAFGFRFQTGLATSHAAALYTPSSVTVVVDGCKVGYGSNLAETQTVFDIENIDLPVVNVWSADNGNTGERFGSPLTQNPAWFR